MYYKISSLILNTGKHQNGSREVFIAQPDAIKEGLAGKLFLLAEIDGKKNDAKKVIDFIIERLDDFYYNDEKIFLQDKIEGLSLDNIFEAALAKLNKALLEFISLEKISLRAEDTNLVLGLVFDNKLLFSNFGRNKAFLIYKRQDDYELVNVEASAAEADNQPENNGPVSPKFFSSVISGEIPASSYFLFCNEALPEYLSNHDLINIITKLPPMVAAEQIKSSLARLNSYVPFLGIIVKNTFGLSLAELKEDGGGDVLQSAHNSISHLNYTEKKTEQMLASAGLINWQNVNKMWKKVKNRGFKSSLSLPAKDGGQNIKKLPSLRPSKTLAAASLIKEKIAFGRSRSRLAGVSKTIGATIINLFNPSFWQKFARNFKVWLNSLHPRNKLMFALLLFAFLILSASLTISSINNRRQANIEYFNNLISTLETKKSMIDSYLLYNNQEGAKTLIGESLAAIDALPVKGEEQISRRDQLRAQIEAQKAQVQKLTTVESPDLLVDFRNYNASAEARNIILSGEKLYAADSAAKAVYTFDLKEKNTASFLLNGDFNALDKPVSEAGAIYYLSGNRLTSLDVDSGKTATLNLDGVGADNKVTAFQFYRSNLYLMMADQNQVYKLSKNTNGFGSKVARLNGEAYLGDAVDMAVNGDIIFLKSNGQIQDYYNGELKDLSLASVDPSLDSASLLKIFNDQLFIMDKASQRILIFDKEGALLKQFRFPALNNLKDFTATSDGKTIYILDNDAIYSISI
ncbi:MAG: hypothetical protein PHG95_02365 [Patescibacteria group bacterium]|nr:hypothetical protein [Patescibacteria group bacterium]